MALSEIDCKTVLLADNTLELSVEKVILVVTILCNPKRPYVLTAIALKLKDVVAILPKLATLTANALNEIDWEIVL